ncbi:cache domain-containing protein [Candidatus Wolfebacteria bacterium]|nr:cache domain-containing protein [Candidatus Wolfebacteria bacterium]
MFKKFILSIIDKYFLNLSRKREILINLLIIFILTCPVIFLAVYSAIADYKELTEEVFSRHKSIANLSAAIVKERLDHMVNIGQSLALRSSVITALKIGDMAGLDESFKMVIKDFSFIDSIFIADINGTMLERTPNSPGNIGKSFAHRDWYQGASKNWEIYVSEVYKRTAQPQINVMAIAFPIKNENNKPVGILVLQINLDIFLRWSKEIEVGPSGFVYFVDRYGQIIAHPKIDIRDNIVNFNDLPAIKEILKGNSGIKIFNNQSKENALVAYDNIPPYGFGALVEQPEK